MSIIETRYAEALVNLAHEKKALDTYQDELSTVAELVRKEEALRNFLFNPENTLAARKGALTGILKGRIHQDVLNLLLLLLDKARITFLPGISREYSRLADEKKRTLNISIYTAVTIDQAQIDSICNKFRTLYGADYAKADLTIDPSLIGGVKVIIGDKLYDGTVKGKLARLQSSLIQF